MEINFNKIFYFFIGRWWIFCNQGENKYLQVCNYITIITFAESGL